MKYKEYERPELEEMELELEGSFLDSATSVDRNETEGEEDIYG